MAVRLQRTLALRFAVTMAVALTGIAVWAYLGVRRALLTQLDDSIRTTAELQRHSLSNKGSLIQVDQLDPSEFVNDINRLVVLRDPSGGLVQTNTPLARDLQLNPEAFGSAQRGAAAFGSSSWKESEVRSIYLPLAAQSSALVLQVSASLEPVNRASRGILLSMLGTALLGSLFALVGAGWLSRSAIAPVAAIAAQAEAIQGTIGPQRITAHADVHELKGLIEVLNRMLARVSHTQAWHRRILQDLGHDLRTPLTAMRTGLQVALRKERPAEEYRRVLLSTLEDIERLQVITDALSLLGQIESGTLEPRLTLLDAGALIQEAVARAMPRLDGHTLEWDPPAVPVPARLDPRLIGMSLDQLIDNALQHTPPGTAIKVALTRRNDALRIEVEDNGPGVPVEALPNLFDRFYRGTESRARHAGAGLGLTTVAAVIDLHHGTVVADSGSEGGLRIRVELPAAAAA